VCVYGPRRISMSFRDRTTLWLPFTKGNRDMWRMTKGYLASSSKISSTHIGKPSRTVRNDVSSYPCRDEWHHSSMHHWSTTNCITQEVFEGTILKILEIAKLLGHRGGISQSSYWTGQDLEFWWRKIKFTWFWAINLPLSGRSRNVQRLSVRAMTQMTYTVIHSLPPWFCR